MPLDALYSSISLLSPLITIYACLNIKSNKLFKITVLCRFEEKISNAESENQVLRQQALAVSPTGKALSARPRTVIIQVREQNTRSLLDIIVYEERFRVRFCAQCAEDARKWECSKW